MLLKKNFSNYYHVLDQGLRDQLLNIVTYVAAPQLPYIQGAEANPELSGMAVF